jgi:hypothetical protein
MNTEKTAPAAQVDGVVSRLSALDIAELRACKRRGYITPRSNPETGKMLASQWKSWKKLERLGCGIIEGMGEADDFSISDFGRLVLKSC